MSAPCDESILALGDRTENPHLFGNARRVSCPFSTGRNALPFIDKGKIVRVRVIWTSNKSGVIQGLEEMEFVPCVPTTSKPQDS